MKFISLFSGIGGFDLGFERAGMECVAQVEIDEKARDVLSRHWANVPKFTDVKEFGNGQFERGTVDLICGGFPCQDLSVAGKRAGLAGERSGLWFEFARVIDELEPRWVVIENVAGLLSSNRGRDFAVILRWLVERGYGVCWRVLDAQYFGVPQRRRRVFIVASLGNGRAAKVLFESEGLRRDIAESREAGKDVAYSLRANPSRSGDKGDGGINTTLVFQQNSRDEVRYIGGDGQVAGALAAQAGMKQKNYMSVNYGKQGGNGMGTMENGLLTAYTPRRTNFDGVENLSPTLNPGNGGFSAPAVGVRRLTPTECERLQGFPDGWTAEQSDTARYRQLGNAVAVPCAEWIGRRIMEAVQP